MAGLQLGNFHLSRVTIEFRYAQNYFLWDRAGTIWSRLRERWPGLEAVGAAPNEQKFSHNREFYCETRLDRSFFIQYDPNADLSDLIENSDYFIETVKNVLDVTHYERIGARFIYYLKCDNKEKSNELLFSTGLVQELSGKHFNIEGKCVYPEYVMRWEDSEENNGVLVKVKSQSEKIDVNAGISIREIEPISLEKHGIYFDIDYYISSMTDVSSLSIKEWVPQVHHLIKRDAKVFLEA